MTETKWTKGPWEAADRGDYGDFDGNSRVILGDDMRIAVVQHHGSEEDEANAHLIASAPDLAVGHGTRIYDMRHLKEMVKNGARKSDLIRYLELIEKDSEQLFAKARGDHS